jgi:beta-barrel assembly-enhancing protease
MTTETLSHRIGTAALSLVLVSMLSACVVTSPFTNSTSSAPPSNSSPSTTASTNPVPSISEEREIEIGDELAVNLLSGAKLWRDERAQEYVNQVGRWVTVVSERPELPWQFGILDRAEIGSYPLPGGKVFITRGMLKKLNNEAELAGVLAHEIAHVLQRHQLRTLSGTAGSDKLGAVNAALDRNLEFEADRMAVVLMVRAGYDPSSYLNVLRTLQSSPTSDSGLALLVSTHPAWKDRISELQPVVEKLAKYNKTNKGRERFVAALAGKR